MAAGGVEDASARRCSPPQDARSHGGYYDTDIILTEHVREQLDPRFSLHDLPQTQVKGGREALGDLERRRVHVAFARSCTRRNSGGESGGFQPTWANEGQCEIRKSPKLLKGKGFSDRRRGQRITKGFAMGSLEVFSQTVFDLV